MSIDLKITDIPEIIELTSLDECLTLVEQIWAEEVAKAYQSLSESQKEENSFLKDYSPQASDPARWLLNVIGQTMFMSLAKQQDSARKFIYPFAFGDALSLVGRRVAGVTRQVTGIDANGLPTFNISDDEFKEIIQTFPDVQSAGGNSNSYKAKTKKVDSLKIIDDVHPFVIPKKETPVEAAPEAQDTSPSANVGVAILFVRETDPNRPKISASDKEVTLSAVKAYLNHEDVKVQGDILDIFPAVPKFYRVDAEVEIPPGVTPEIVLAEARQSLFNYLNSRRVIKGTVRTSGIIAAIYSGMKGRFNVENVVLNSPEASIECDDRGYPEIAVVEDSSTGNLKFDIDIREAPKK